MSTEISIEKVMRKLGDLVALKSKKEYTPGMLELFMEALEDYTPEQILYGIKKTMQTDTFGIQPSDIIKHLKPNSEDIHSKAIIESQKALRSLKTGNSSYFKGDPITESLMQGRWNLETVNVGGQF